MVSTPLISCAELSAALGEPGLRVIDCRFDLGNPDAGTLAYAECRIPGARYAHLDRDLSDLSLKSTHGRHPLPSSMALSASMSRLGVERGTQVVAYDQDSGMYAARLWWLLRECGHAQVRVLDGGYARWLKLGLTLEQGTPPNYPSKGLPEALDLRAGALVGADQLLPALHSNAMLLLDARGAARFRGEVEPIDPVAGHVPGARNRPFTENLAPDGCFKAPEQLRAEFEALLVGQSPASVVHMCGSGVTACHNRLAMDVAGLNGSRLYADSWSGWITDPGRPIATGP